MESHRDDVISTLDYPLPSDDPELVMIRDWLLTKHVSLWSQFELVKDGPARAAVWFLDEIRSYERYKEEHGQGAIDG